MNDRNRHFGPSLSLKAFSLVEVTLALGLIAFCLLGLVGLLPVGLKEVSNSRAESAAANAVDLIADALRNGTLTSSGMYVASGSYSNISWAPGGAEVPVPMDLTLSGMPSSGSAETRLVARVEVTPPSSDFTTPGEARVSVAWPASAVWSGDAWTKSDGSISTGIQFIPHR